MNTNICNEQCTLSLDGIMVGISINLKPDLLAQIDEAKGPHSRSSYIVNAVYAYLNPTKADWEADRMQLTTQVEALKDTQRRLEDEISYLRDQNARLTDAVAVKLLAEPKKSWWSRFRRKQS